MESLPATVYVERAVFAFSQDFATGPYASESFQEDLQSHGSGLEGGKAFHPGQRLGRSSHSGRDWILFRAMVGE